MAKITQTISTVVALPEPPNPNVPSTFDTLAYPYTVAQRTFGVDVNDMATELNTFATQANAVRDEVNTLKLSAETAENNAETAEAKAEQWAEGVGEVETGKYSAKHWADHAEAVTATIPEGTINDATTTLIDTWSSSKINSEIESVETAITNAVPSGTVIYTAKNVAPAGYLKANGALVSRTVYASLFASIGTTFGAGNGSTTFALPDLRGYFLRSFDDGRGVDSGRVFGSTQDDDNKSHTHTGSTNSTGEHTHTIYGGNTGGSGGQYNETFSYNQMWSTQTSSSGNHSHTLTINSTGGTESRPKNIALLACIKY